MKLCTGITLTSALQWPRLRYRTFIHYLWPTIVKMKSPKTITGHFLDAPSFFFKARLRACLHGRAGPQVGEVTRDGSPHLSCSKRDRQVTSPKRVTSSSWGLPSPCKQALKIRFAMTIVSTTNGCNIVSNSSHIVPIL